ncbi:TetR/AcrR family transcriptional regulator [Sphingobium sp. EM0848]|uniref:TetR/AcrR family transcriptional regulator n=1 Tax=Sphingobium sp. EM0848 TaxID=2743473 RepID=UPI00159C6FFB|nr:TetR/AcrR family transcriptional regulator [Sphingobium sp. EM0848]
MRSTANPPRRGRPTKAEAAERQAHLLDIARSVFAELGYAAASIELIASKARVGKQTIYSRYGDKAGLFRTVVLNIRYLRLQIPDSGLFDDALQSGLQQRLGNILQATLEPDYAALFRLFLREATAFPEVFEAFSQVSESHIERPLTHFLEGHIAQGMALKLPLKTCVDLLMAMLNSFISITVLRGTPAIEEQIQAEAHAITQLFLYGGVIAD